MATAGDPAVKPDHVIIWCDRNMAEEGNNEADKAVLNESANLNRPPSSTYTPEVDDLICNIDPGLNNNEFEHWIKSSLRMFTNEKECLKCIHDSIEAGKRVFLITSGEKGMEIVPKIHNILSGYIYIFCAQRDWHEKKWAGPYKEDIEFYDDGKGVFVKLLVEIGAYYRRKSQEATGNLAGATQYLNWTKRLIMSATRIDNVNRKDYLDFIQEELSDLEARASDGVNSDVPMGQAVRN